MAPMPLDMRPRFPADDLADVSLRHAEHGGKGFLTVGSSSVKRPDCDDIGFSQFGVETSLSPQYKFRMLSGIVAFSAHDKLRVSSHVVVLPGLHASLGGRVLNVIRSTAQKIMNRIAAGRIVAGVQDAERDWIPAMAQKIRYAIRPEHPLLFRWTITKRSIAMPCGAALPKPALVLPSPVDFRPESFDVFRGKRKERSTISSSHSASYSGRLGQGRAVLNTPHGPLNYAT